MSELAQALAGIAAVLVSVLAIVKGGGKLAGLVRRVSRVLDDFLGTPAEDGREAQPGVLEEVRNVKALVINGLSSKVDLVAALAERNAVETEEAKRQTEQVAERLELTERAASEERRAITETQQTIAKTLDSLKGEVGYLSLRMREQTEVAKTIRIPSDVWDAIALADREDRDADGDV